MIISAFILIPEKSKALFSLFSGLLLANLTVTATDVNCNLIYRIHSLINNLL